VAEVNHNWLRIVNFGDFSLLPAPRSG